VEQEQVRQVVVTAGVGDDAEVLGLRAADDDLCGDIALTVGTDRRHCVGQVGERVDQRGPDGLADGTHLSVAVQYPLAGPHLERHVPEIGVVGAQLGHPLDIVRPVGVEERADRARCGRLA
jgi:hypothetical protein